MGLRLPIHPYYAGKGKAKAKTLARSHFNEDARSSLEKFQEYLTRPDVKRYAVQLIPGRLNPQDDDWFCPYSFDGNADEHQEFVRLLESVGKKGTILIPDTTHITGSRERRIPKSKLVKIVEKIDDENIEILPLTLKFKRGGIQRRYDLTKIVNSGEPDPTIFEIMPQMAMETAEYLKRFVSGQKGTRRASIGTKKKRRHNHKRKRLS